MQLYFVRHGETEWNREYRYYGVCDIPLNEKGKRQARELGELLKDFSFTTIYTSPLKRAKQTADDILNRQTKAIPIIESTFLQEQNLGIFEGHTYQELQKLFPKKLEQWSHDFKSNPHEGERFCDLHHRVYRFCSEVLGIRGLSSEEKEGKHGLYVAKEREQEKILIVSHMAVLRCFFTILLGMKEDSIWNFTVEQGAYSRIDIEDGYAIIRKINQR